MEQPAFITPNVAHISLINLLPQNYLATPDWSSPTADAETALLWQQFTLLQARLSGINQRRNGPVYRAVRHQLSRIALLLTPRTTDLALASILLSFMMPGHLASGQAQVQAKAQYATVQSLVMLQDLDERGLMHLLIAVHGDVQCQAVVNYITERLDCAGNPNNL